jgi:hypothetical protein
LGFFFDGSSSFKVVSVVAGVVVCAMIVEIDNTKKQIKKDIFFMNLF